MAGNRPGQGAHRTHAHTRHAMPSDLCWPAECSRSGAVRPAYFQRRVLCFRTFAELLSFIKIMRSGAHASVEAGAFIRTLREADRTPELCSRTVDSSGDRRRSDRSGPPSTGSESADT